MNTIQKIGLIIMSLFVMVMTLSAMPVDVKDGDVEKEKIHKLLELSDSQVKRIKKYRQNTLNKGNYIKRELKIKNKSLEEELFKPDSNPETIDKLQGEISHLNEEKLNYKIRSVKELRTVLDPSQIKKLEFLKKEHKKIIQKKKDRFINQEYRSKMVNKKENVIKKGTSTEINPVKFKVKPMVKPDKPMVKPDKPMVKPDKPMVKPDKPMVKPDKPMVKPDKPMVKPDKPMVKPDKLMVKPDKLMVKPDKPMVKPDKLMVKPDKVKKPKIDRHKLRVKKIPKLQLDHKIKGE